MEKDPIWSPGETLQQTEKRIILTALRRHDWSRTYTAKELGISIRTLRVRIAEYRAEGTEVPYAPKGRLSHGDRIQDEERPTFNQ